ncbi:pentatricopeptide repeat-containing protein At1g30610, chloroplastic-like [Vitis riparia]|uniref:pentatricopeptide repeat-containing protein At1g30610, chloroplastic-like n=1 Tax=Vitis riparia TaxID=96939 RepID=UPI00155A2D93|nr:pentatricopeptide repeat-containing protein At1g30610, chloroplastic-like [Vitis riparia]
MVNAQMGSFILQGIGCFSSNCNWNTPSSLGFSVSWRPSFGVAVNARRTNCITVNTLLREESNGRSADNGLLDKELEFKPSFGEYLKTMESVRTGRGKNQSRNLNRSKSSSRRGKGVLRMPSLERDEENVNLGDFKGHPYQEKKSKFGKQDELYKNSGGRSARGMVQDELDLGWENDDENSSEILEGKGSSKSQRDDKLKGRAFKADSGGLGRKGMRKRHEMNGAQVEKVGDEKIGIKKGNFNKSRKGFLEKGGDDILEIERAAFKNFEAFNDITVKKPVSKMEMEERIQKLAKLLNGADIDMPEWMFSKMMQSAKIRFTDHSILRVIQILGKLGNWRRALQVLEWLQLRERFKSHKLRYIYTAALDVLGKARRPVEALNVFYAMLQQMSSYPDLVAYHCIAVTLGQAGHMKELFDVIDCMRSPPRKKFKTGALEKWDPRLEPDIIVYNAVLNACVRRKQWEGAFWVLQQLKQQSQKPSITTYGLVMEVMFVCGKYNLVHEFFWKVQKSSIPNALTYKVLVNTLWREGKTDKAVLAVQDMEKRGVVGSAALYYDLARCLCSAGRCQEALMQIEKICKVANKPLVVTYTGLIQACLDSGNVQNAAFIFNQMHEFCSPNLITCNVMLKAYLEHRMFEEAKELFGKMLGDGNRISSKSDYNDRVLPDIYTFNTMIDACNAEKRWDDLEYVYEWMLHHGFHFNAKRHLRIILDASRAGKEELLETTWKRLAGEGRVPPPLIKERFCMKLEKGDCAAAVSSITGHHMKELQEPFSKRAWMNLFTENAGRFQTESLVELMHEASVLIARADMPNLVLQNLLASCKEFLRTHMTVSSVSSESSRTETATAIQSEVALKS